MRKLVIVAALVAADLVLGTAATPAGRSAPVRATGTLELRGSLEIVSDPSGCPPSAPPVGACSAVTGGGLVPGLGRVTEAYTFLGDSDSLICPGGYGKVLAYPVSMVVAGKGAIHFALAEGSTCVPNEAIRVQSQAFTVTGGTGIYEGASGSGRVERVLRGATAGGLRRTTQTWIGTLVAPGVGDFDLTAPTLTGATNRTARAPRGAKAMRVRFSVTARDAIDGPRPVSCRPRSASRFELGRTTVTCTAADTSGNVGSRRFTVTVRALP